MYKNNSQFQVKSAGTEANARIRINTRLIDWADLIFVMERKHKEKLQQQFPEELQFKELIVLDIPDIYKYMDAELIEEIESAVAGYI